jgi:hypothetical protein
MLDLIYNEFADKVAKEFSECIENRPFSFE